MPSTKTLRKEIINPILVTGAERTGTTWVGQMLCASLFGWRDIVRGSFKTLLPAKHATYLSEAFNIISRCIWMRPEIAYWSTYICYENEENYIEALRSAFSFKYPFWQLVSSLRDQKKLRNDLVEWVRFQQGRWMSSRPLLKDPGALFSAPWFAKRFNAQVVITVRHPLAFVSSRNRVQWPIRVEDWLSQPLLIRDLLCPYEEEIQRKYIGFQRNQFDLIDLACLYWNVAYQVTDTFRKKYPDFVVVRHEDLAKEPVQGFHTLYQKLRLDFTLGAEDRIRFSSASGNPSVSPANDPHRIRLDSHANLYHWKHYLTTEEIKRTRLATEETASLFYPESFWNQPTGTSNCNRCLRDE